MYTEYLIEYDEDILVVYVSGLDADDFWDELYVHDEVNDPKEFAEGYAQRMKDEGLSVSVVNVTGIEEEL